MGDRTVAIAANKRWFLKRRGLLAGVAAAVAGTLHQSQVEVAHAAQLTGFTSALGEVGVRGTHNATTGSNSHGVEGSTASSGSGASGVKGNSNNTAGATNGVTGSNLSVSTSAAGVYGVMTEFASTGSGVFGRSFGTGDLARGVYGEIDPLNGTGSGVWGLSRAGVGTRGESTSGTGVRGISSSGTGVRGESASQFGVFGSSTSSFGCGGSSSAPGTAGLFGYASAPAAVGLQGIHTVAGSFAGFFTGDVYISGRLTVASGAKSAAVKKKDGSMARVYCQESPEPWFEDFGTAPLTNGQAVVDLDPEFDEVVKGDDYRVFLTAIGNTGFLYVSRKGPHRFEVRSDKGAAATGSFDYRVVARRAEAVGGRLEKVQVPSVDIDKLKRQMEASAPASANPRKP